MTFSQSDHSDDDDLSIRLDRDGRRVVPVADRGRHDLSASTDTDVQCAAAGQAFEREPALIEVWNMDEGRPGDNYLAVALEGDGFGGGGRRGENLAAVAEARVGSPAAV